MIKQRKTWNWSSLKTFKWSLFGLLKATKLVIFRSSFGNFSMNTKPGNTAPGKFTFFFQSSFVCQYVLPPRMLPVVMLSSKSVQPGHLWYHALLLLLFSTYDILQQRPCAICSLLFLVATVSTWQATMQIQKEVEINIDLWSVSTWMNIGHLKVMPCIFIVSHFSILLAVFVEPTIHYC